MTEGHQHSSAGSMDETFVEWLGKTRKKLEGMMSSTYDFPSDNEGIGHTGDAAQPAAGTRFLITWDRGAYYVSIPNYKGGEVVDATEYDRVAALYDSEDKKAADEIASLRLELDASATQAANYRAQLEDALASQPSPAATVSCCPCCGNPTIVDASGLVSCVRCEWEQNEPPAAPVETACCKGLAPQSECRCEIERKAAGHPPYHRSSAVTDALTAALDAKLKDPAFIEFANNMTTLNEVGLLPIIKLRPTSVSDWLVVLPSGREIGIRDEEWKSAIIPDQPQTVKERSDTEAANWARLSASEYACYRWPEDTAEHRAMRAAFMDGAAHAVTNDESSRTIGLLQQGVMDMTVVERLAWKKRVEEHLASPLSRPNRESGK